MKDLKPKEILKLEGKNLRCVAMPLGGIGTGSIAIGGDGFLKQWQITNTIKHNAFVPNSFFAISIKKPNDTIITKALHCSEVHEGSGFKPAKSVSDYRVTSTMKEMFDILQGVDSIEFIGEYPIAFLKYHDSEIPVEINLTAFNPLIPLDEKNSGLPLIIFQFDLKNISQEPIEILLSGTLMNFIGWDGFKTLSGNENLLFGGNVNILRQIEDWNIIQMKSKSVLKNDKRYGDLTLAIKDPNALSTRAWDNLHSFWSTLSSKGEFINSNEEEMSPLGKTWMGSLGKKTILKQGESDQVTFILAWNFPNRLVDWTDSTLMNYDKLPDLKTEFWIGNNYSNYFDTSLDVINYANNNWNYLLEKASQFHDNLFSMTLPKDIITSISAPMSTIRSPTSFWIKDGTFHSFEGCCGASTTKSSGGSCPLDCTHVWNYAFSLAKLFPSLERTMRATEFKIQNEKGYIPHRSVLPLYLPQLENTTEMPPAIDGMFGMILKIYRDYLLTGDEDYLEKSWPRIEKLMNYVLRNFDEKLRGVIHGSQPNTYDCELFGINTFIGTLYLTTLLACEKIAQKLGSLEWKEKFRKAFNSGSALLDSECWNGEYYIQKYDDNQIREFQYGEGCHSDQLLGQWWAFNLGFGYILPAKHVDKAIESIIKYNFKDTLEDVKQFRIFASPQDSGLLNCTWPYGNKPENPIRYGNEVWTGIEYEVSSLCFYLGRIEEGLKIIDAIRKRYDGTHRNPWNEVECGDHYVRAMASWTLLPALTGVHYDVELKQFKIAPKTYNDYFSTFFITSKAWGKIIFKDSKNISTFSLLISHGELELNSLNLQNLGRFRLINNFTLFRTFPIEAKESIEFNLSSSNESSTDIFLKNNIKIKEDTQILIELKK